jgi:capsid portal protein
MKSTHRSNDWGMACLPIAINIEILGEIKTFDYNNFKNGLMIDYFVIVEGGTLRDGSAVDEEGNEVISDAYSEIERTLTEVKGNSNSHSTVLIESENKDVKIRLEPLRQQDREGGFLSLKKDLREGILAYHRVPARIVSQLIPGQLGGDNRSDMALFYHFVVKPLQERLALTLANEFNYEFNWNVKASDFDFGDLTQTLKTDDERLFDGLRNN